MKKISTFVLKTVWVLVCALALLAAAAIAGYKLGNVWWGLASVLATTAVLMQVVSKSLNIGEMFGYMQASNEARKETEEGLQEMPPDMRELVTGLLEQYGLTPATAHKVGGTTHDTFDDEHAEVQQLVKRHAEGLIDGDLKELCFHISHIMSDCPGAHAHAKRLQEVTDHLEVRLKASTVAPTSDDDRPTVH